MESGFTKMSDLYERLSIDSSVQWLYLDKNDENDFIHEGNRRDRRRRNLREIKLDHRSDILTSQEAYDMISADFA